VVVSCSGSQSTDDGGVPFNRVVEKMCEEQRIVHIVFCPSFRSAKNLCRSSIAKDNQNPTG
jgi:hypothetical protein